MARQDGHLLRHDCEKGSRVVFGNVFFFSSRRRHTRCSRDWSSDVCSSDLSAARVKACVFRRRLPPNRSAPLHTPRHNSSPTSFPKTSPNPSPRARCCRLSSSASSLPWRSSWFPKQNGVPRSEEHTSELQSRLHLVCRLLLE